MNLFDYFFPGPDVPEKDFVLGAGETASYREIYEDSLKIAAFLRREAGENRHIILLSENSVFFIKVYLGILRSGNICIPVNPMTEPSSLAYIAGHTGCPLLFLGAERADAAGPRVRTLGKKEVEGILHRGDHAAGAWPDDFDGNRTAAIIFTSGSTGAPKGVMLSHLNIRSNTDSILEYLDLGREDIAGVVLPFYYCYGLSVLHTHLRSRASVVLINSFMFIGQVIQDLKRYRCTGFAGVPSHFQILLRRSGTFRGACLPDLRYATQAGGRLHDIFITEFMNAFPGIPFFVMYGQTEASARLACLPPERLPEKLGSIGRAIPGVTLAVMRDDRSMAGPGEVGELVARGPNIMKGYFKDPESTGEVLKDAWLHTGDLARTDQDGYIYLVGRKKEIIKVGGHRVSPQEIEEVILSVPEVMDCTVKAVYDDLLGEGLEATVVVTGGTNDPGLRNRILQQCRQKLALYKVPRLITFQNSMNVNTAGKKINQQPPIIN